MREVKPSRSRARRRTFFRALLFLAALVFILWAYYRVWFLRQPDRQPPMDVSVMVSPANGKVAAVAPWDSSALALRKDLGTISVLTRDIGPRGLFIAIEMDVTNVHYQRAPVRSRLISSTYRPGAFRNALITTNPFGIRLENEHNAMLFETSYGLRFKVVQIAGLLARRIEGYLEPGQLVDQGELIGLIKLGSQVAVILPEGVEPAVTPGQTVVDGETVIARLP